MTSEQDRILFLADAHLRGPGDPNQEAWLEFLDRQDMDHTHLVLLGDVFDFLAGTNAYAAARYRPVLDRLARFRRLTYLEGNHDFDLDPSTCGLPASSLHPGPLRLALHGRKLLLMHGDRTSPTDLGTRLLRGALQSTPLRWLRDRVLPGSWVFRFALAFANTSRARPWPGRRDEEQDAHRAACSWLKKEQADGVVYAHTHQAVLEDLQDGLVANPGAAVLGGTYLEGTPNSFALCQFPSGRILSRLVLR